MENKKIKIIGVVGPTASGKTKLSIEIAKSIGAEIVSCDSMQIYKGMNIATAKPTKEEMQNIKHHLIDFLCLSKKFNVCDYVNMANNEIDDIIKRGNKVILCGGTGLYIDSLINDIKFSNHEVDFNLRENLAKKAQEKGGEVLLQELCEFDKEYAGKLHPNNIKKIIRAIEVYYTTNISMTDHIKNSNITKSRYESLLIGLNYRDRSTLYDKINNRVDIMLENGLINEAKDIFESKYNSTALSAIGYKELIPYFEGQESKEEAIEKIKRESRKYAKRQLTWFRKNKNINWIFIEDHNNFDSILQTSLNLIKSCQI